MSTPTFEQLQTAVAKAKRHFGLLRDKYPDLRAYLVLSLPAGQTGIDSGPQQILAEFPAMIGDGPAKAEALALSSALRQLDWRIAANPKSADLASKREQMSKRLAQLLSQFTYVSHCQVELRFTDLNYDLIARLQTDDLVDCELTPQTRASIRIVLGTVATFGRTK